jgi:hypothetical protein
MAGYKGAGRSNIWFLIQKTFKWLK